MTDLLSAMHSRPDGKDGRKSYQLYVIHEDLSVRQATGWECHDYDGKLTDMYWFPSLGYSTSAVYHSEAEAHAEQHRRIKHEIERLSGLLDHA